MLNFKIYRDEIFDGKMSVEDYECFWNCNEKAEGKKNHDSNVPELINKHNSLN